MPNSPELIKVLSNFLDKAQSVLTLISKLREVRYPSENPMLHADVVHFIVSASRDSIVNRYNSGEYTEYSFIHEIRFAFLSVVEITENLRYTQRAMTRIVPWSTILPLEMLARRLFPNSRLVVRPQWSYNYSLVEVAEKYIKDFQSYLSKDDKDKIYKILENSNSSKESLKENNKSEAGEVKESRNSDENDESIKRIFILGFPYLERLNILMHTIIGHEFGHPIAKDYREKPVFDQFPIEIKRSFDNIKKYVNNFVSEEMGEGADKKEKDLRKREKEKRILGFRNRAIDEIIGDLVCLQIYGIAAIFALEHFLSIHSLDAFDPSVIEKHYPPARYRLRVLYNAIPNNWMSNFVKKSNFSKKTKDVIKNKIDEIREIVSDTSDEKELNKKKEISLAYKSVKVTIKYAETYVNQRLKKRGISINDLIGLVDINKLNRLEIGIPPNKLEYNENDDWINNIRGIINIGWIYFLEKYYGRLAKKHIDGESQDEYFEDIYGMNRVLLKSIENEDIISLHNVRKNG